MFEDMTYQNIMARMLDRIPDNLDKREGSIIWDALSPAALELELGYIFLEYILDESFADTADLEYLIRRCAERGITREAATSAVIKGEFTPTSIDVTGQRFNLNKLNYTVTSADEDNPGTYYLTCEDTGTQGNQTGTLVPIDYIEGLETASATEISIPGEDDEDVETLRTRYFSSISTKAYGGNKQDYLDKTNSLDGVGATKVIPLWNGAGTVKILILDTTYGHASSALIDSVQNELDPTQDGTGYGLAPIGHVVTVDTPAETTINVTTTIDFDDGYTWESCQTAIEAAIESYLAGLRENWASSTSITVRISQIESKLLHVEGVLDVTGTTINGSAANLIISDNGIPVLGTVTSN